MGCWILPQAWSGWPSWSLVFWRTKSKRAPKFLYLGVKGTAILGLGSQSWVMLSPYFRVLYTHLSMSKCTSSEGEWWRVKSSEDQWCPRPAEVIQSFECVNRRPRVGLPSLQRPVPSSVTVHPLYILASPPTHIIIQASPSQMCRIQGTTSPKMAFPALSWSPALCLAWREPPVACGSSKDVSVHHRMAGQLCVHDAASTGSFEQTWLGVPLGSHSPLLPLFLWRETESWVGPTVRRFWTS